MEKPASMRWSILGMLFLVSVVTYLDRINISIAGAKLTENFGFSKIQLGNIFSAFVLGYAAFQIVGGWLGDRFGHKRILNFAIVWWSIFTALTAYAGHSFLVSLVGLLPAFIIVRFLIGAGEAAAYPCSNGIIARWFVKEERARAAGILFAGIGVGSTITPPFIAWLMINYGWETAFYVSGVIGLILALAFYTFVPADEEKTVAEKTLEDSTNWREILSNPQLWLLTLSNFFNGYVAYIYFSWFYLYLVDVRGFTLLSGSYFASLPFAAIAIGAPLGGVVSDYLLKIVGSIKARRFVAFGGLFLAAILMILGAQITNQYLSIAALSLAAGFLSATLSSYWATASEISDKKSATVTGIMNTGNTLGGVLSPTLTPLIAVNYGWTTALLVGAGFSLLGGILWLFIGRKEDDGK